MIRSQLEAAKDVATDLLQEVGKHDVHAEEANLGGEARREAEAYKRLKLDRHLAKLRDFLAKASECMRRLDLASACRHHLLHHHATISCHDTSLLFIHPSRIDLGLVRTRRAVKGLPHVPG